jgi:flagellar M-ring protein FliF
VLKLKGKSGGVLKPEQVASITHLVSSSVEGLTPENVTISDTRGNLLSKKESSLSMIGASNDQLEVKKKIEDYLVVKAQDLLEKMVGEGKSIVRISADLDFKHVDEKMIEFDPERRVPRVQTVTTRASGGSSPFSGGGIPGMQANLSQSGIVQSVGSSEEEETAQTQYELSKTERIIANHGANLKRLSVAVLVDGSYGEEKTVDGKIQRVYIPRSNEDMARISSLVKQAIGVDLTNRNDTFEVQNVQFYEPSFEDEDVSIKKEEKKEFMLKMAKNGSLAITVLAFLLFVMRSMKKIKKAGKVQSRSVGQEAYQIVTKGSKKMNNVGEGEHTETIIQSQPQTQSQAKALADMALLEDEVNEEELHQEALRQRIIEKVKKDPQATSVSLKKWLSADLAGRAGGR